jgi:hypothetical protein
MNEELMNRIISQLRMPLVLHRDQDSQSALYQASATSLANGSRVGV